MTGTCNKFTQTELIRWNDDGTLYLFFSGQWMSETKRTKRIGPFLARLVCTPVDATRKYNCTSSDVHTQNYLNDSTEGRNEECGWEKPGTKARTPFENPFTLDVHLRTYVDYLTVRVENEIETVLSSK